MVDQRLTVTGMSCGGCESTVEDALEDLAGVGTATADHESDVVRLDLSGDPSEDAVLEAVRDAGYEPG